LGTKGWRLRAVKLRGRERRGEVRGGEAKGEGRRGGRGGEGVEAWRLGPTDEVRGRHTGIHMSTAAAAVGGGGTETPFAKVWCKFGWKMKLKKGFKITERCGTAEY